MNHLFQLVQDAKVPQERKAMQNTIENEYSSIHGLHRKQNFFFVFVKFVSEDYLERPEHDTENAEYALLAFSPRRDMDEIVVLVARNFALSEKHLQTLFKHFNTISEPKDLLKNMMYMPEHHMYYGIAANTILNANGIELTPSEVEELSYEAESVELNTQADVEAIVHFVNDQTSKTEQYAEKPDWVSLKDGESMALLSEVSTALKEDEKKGFYEDFLQKGKDLFLFSDNIEYEEGSQIEAEKAIKCFLSIMGSQELIKEEEGSEEELEFRVWGPENRIPGVECCAGPKVENADGIEEAVGPCRMLLCECREYDPDLDQEYDGDMTWFKGKCDGCHLKIRDLSHALRFPVAGGGWKGCFCCFKCLEEKSPYPIKAEERISLNMMKQYIDRIGVMDRSLV